MPQVKFTKMHGIGNDYVYINCFRQQIDNPSELAVKMSPRRFSVGADGVILICPSDVADAKMRMFNLDGSEGKMCGNGIRCVGKFLYDQGMINVNEKSDIKIETLSGIKDLKVYTRGGEVKGLRVDMGKAILDPKEIPVKSDKETIINEPVTIEGAKSYLAQLFFDAHRYDLSRVGRYKYNKKLAISERILPWSLTIVLKLFVILSVA